MQNKQGNGKDNRIVALISGVLALAAVFCLPQMMNLKGNTLAVSNSWFSMFAYGIFWFLCYRSMLGIRQADGNTIRAEKEKEVRHGMIVAGIMAGLFSLCIAFGVQLDRKESVNFRDGVMWLSVLTWTMMLTLWIYRGWMLLEQRGIGEGKAKGWMSRDKSGGGFHRWKGHWQIWREKWERLSERRRAAATMCFLLFCWLPVFLAVYPGFFVYDAQDELIQVQTRQFTTHHPLPHVLLLGGIIQAVHKLTGSYNAGIAVYTIVQMASMAGVFTYVLSYMKKAGIGRWLRVISAFYFGCFPVNVMFVLCSAKDGIFTGALLLLLTALVDMVKDRDRFFADRREILVFGMSALVMMSFRHNGIYAFLVLAPVMIVFCGKGYRQKMGLLFGLAFGGYVLISAGLTTILSAQTSENQEMLTVPIQQLARVWKYERESLTEEQKETLYEILPEEVLPFYTAKVSDGVKLWFDNEAFAAHPGKYLRLWAEVGSRHPFTYLNAWFMTSYGFWYPDTVIDVYRGNSVFTFTYGDSSFFGYEVEQPGVRESRIPWLNEWYRKISLEIAQQKVPVVSMLFSPGFLFWVFVFAGGYAYYRKKYELLPACGMILLLWLTVILGPTYLPRYVLILWFALPGAAAVLVNEG